MSTTPAPSVRDSNKSAPYFPLAGLANDGYSKDGEATATCFCGAVQIAFITASMFASNFTVKDKYMTYIRGQDNLKQFGQKETIARTVDDFNLVETKLKPTREIFVKDRVGWLNDVSVEGIKRFEGM
ncbi:hypothetical protein N0V83_009113 [Neocucurbitaria cava]|uniref:Uncharacterized protein n=1 Tax=Neocucurbitaria cava TaxID=798079 RepID=A0A9W8Y090_9PLEO|nr:hypothetical protein N0V83_009113 [Neocucurbitaria cava]